MNNVLGKITNSALFHKFIFTGCAKLKAVFGAKSAKQINS
jgi:hypothetical protein